jgi:hypothetical protein
MGSNLEHSGLVELRASPVRCPFCHGSVGADLDDSAVCARCLARHHRECWSEGAGCASCRETEALASFSSARRTRSRAQLVSFVVAGVLAAVVVSRSRQPVREPASPAPVPVDEARAKVAPMTATLDGLSCKRVRLAAIERIPVALDGSAVALAPSGRSLVVASPAGLTTFAWQGTWQAGSRGPPGTLIGASAGRLLVARPGTRVWLVNPENGREECTPVSVTDPVFGALSSDGRRAVVAGPAEAVLLDLPSGRGLARLEAPGEILAAQFVDDDVRILCRPKPLSPYDSWKREVRSLGTGAVLHSESMNYTVAGVFLEGGRQFFAGDNCGYVCRRAVGDGKRFGGALGWGGDSCGPARTLALSPDETRIVVLRRNVVSVVGIVDSAGAPDGQELVGTIDLRRAFTARPLCEDVNLDEPLAASWSSSESFAVVTRSGLVLRFVVSP